MFIPSFCISFPFRMQVYNALSYRLRCYLDYVWRQLSIYFFMKITMVLKKQVWIPSFSSYLRMWDFKWVISPEIRVRFLSAFIVVTSKVTPIFARNFLPPLKSFIKVHIISDYGDAMSMWDVLLFQQHGNFYYMDGPLTFSMKAPVWICLTLTWIAHS